MDRIQGLSVFLSVLFIVQVLWFIKKQQFRERQAYLWVMLSAAGVLTALSIQLLNRVAQKVGVAYMPALVFVLAFYVVLTLLMLHAASASREQAKLKTLVQEVACIRHELEELKVWKEREAGAGQPDQGGREA